MAPRLAGAECQDFLRLCGVTEKPRFSTSQDMLAPGQTEGYSGSDGLRTPPGFPEGSAVELRQVLCRGLFASWPASKCQDFLQSVFAGRTVLRASAPRRGTTRQGGATSSTRYLPRKSSLRNRLRRPSCDWTCPERDGKGKRITVGRPVTRPPPYRSRRAELPHRALRSYSLRTWRHRLILRSCGRCVDVGA